MMSGCKTLKVAGEVNENQDTVNSVDTLATVSASEDDTTKSTIVSLQKTDTIAVDSVSKNDTVASQEKSSAPKQVSFIDDKIERSCNDSTVQDFKNNKF
jgi:hypothetical protein